jgi:transposase
MIPAAARPAITRSPTRRCFGKLKQFRAAATRDDKRDFTDQAAVGVASIRIRLRDLGIGALLPGR